MLDVERFLSMRNLFCFCALVITFLFLPGENWFFWFLSDKSQSYAEFIIESDLALYLLTKNTLDKPVHVQIEDAGAVTGSLHKMIDRDIFVDRDNKGTALPRSYSLIEIRKNKPMHGAELGPQRSVAEEFFFDVQPLTIMVPAEVDRWIFLAFPFFAMIAWLTFSLASYFIEAKRLETQHQKDCSASE